MREFGAPPGTTGAATQQTSLSARIAVDATSSVTLLGWSSGPVDLGSGPVDASGGDVSFVMRIDSGGNTVYTRTYSAFDSPATILGVHPDGSAAFLFFDYLAYTCLLSPVSCDGGGPPEAGTYGFSFVQLDPTGSEVVRQPFPGFPAISGSAGSSATFTDLSLDPDGMIWAVDNYTDAGSSVQRLMPNGTPLWSRPPRSGAGSPEVVVTAAGGLVFCLDHGGGRETFELVGFDGGLSWARSTALATTEPVAGDVVVDPKGAIYFAGQLVPPPSAPPNTPSPLTVFGVQTLDSQGRNVALREWTTGGKDDYRALGVDSNGNAIVGGDAVDGDGGISYFLVKLGP